MHRISLITLKSLTPLLVLLFIGIQFTQAQTFTSIRPGAIDDPLVWSTNGGTSPCNCTPTTDFSTFSIINKGNVVINHEIVLTKNTIMVGFQNTLTVNNAGSLKGNAYNFEIRGGLVTNNGEMIFARLNINFRSRLYNYNTLAVVSGNLNVGSTGGLLIEGQVFVNQGSIINAGVTNFAQNTMIELVGNEMLNLGTMNLEQGSCLTFLGNVTNRGYAGIYGFRLGTTPDAFINISGNITNQGSWMNGLDWCASGTDYGLPFAENCNGYSSSRNKTNEIETTVTESMQVFPNPFNETLRFSTEGMEGQTFDLQMTDLNGRVVFTHQIEDAHDYQVYEMQPGSLTPGMYLVTVRSENTVKTFKVLHP